MTRLKLPNWLKWSADPALHIGIDGLTTSASCLEVGSQYLLAIDDAQARLTLLCATLRAALISGRNCVVVSADPTTLYQQLQTRSVSFGTEQNQGSLLLLTQFPDIQANLQRFGCERFLTELEAVGTDSASLLIVEAADDFLNGQDIAQLKQQLFGYRQWFNDWQMVGLFLSTASTSQQLKNIVVQHPELFSGIAEFRRDLGSYRWMIEHWYSAFGVLKDASFEIQSADNGQRLLVVDAPPVSDLNVNDASVYYTAQSIDGDEKLPEGWICCFSYQDVLAVATTQLTQAAVVLHYRQQAEFPLLAQTIHQLRFSVGRQMRIVIREQGEQLRYSQELLLTRLGANQIVYLEFGISRLLRTVEASIGHRFLGNIEADFEQALAAAMPSEECGYLPPGKFCQLVNSSLLKTEAINMHHVLVRLDMLPEQAHLDVLLKCQPHRANDVVTADESHVYIFLFACRQPDIESALSRIIIEPLEQMFSGQSHWSGRLNIIDALAELQTKSQLTGLADFSQLLPVYRHQTTDGAAAQHVDNVKGQSLPDAAALSTPAGATTPLERTVVPHAFKLRG